MASTAAPIQNRPYRSHRVPACTRCRARKIRCAIDIPGEPCLSCRERRLKCQYVDATASTTPTDANGERRTSKRRRTSNHGGADDAPTRPRSAPILHKASNNPSASIMLAPHMAEDVGILQRHISRHRTTTGDAQDPYQTLSQDAEDPIIYLTVPRFRAGLPPGVGCGKEQLEIIEQLMGPFKREVIDLYFNHVHYNFPILDAETCALLQKGPIDKVPRNLMCVVYAIGAPHWSKSDTLKMHPRPDWHYVWNKAISATLEDFLSPSIPTISTAVLDQIGRPSVSIVGNITLCGRTVSLAQTFGLHRDPSKWNITENEKLMRVRIWWGVLISDYWSSIAYGAPPHVSKGFYDVPMPTVNSLISSKASFAQKHALTCFVHLCQLTELLGDILPIVYEIDPDRLKLSQDVGRFKSVLTNLESQLPGWLPVPSQIGSSNLWFCFLSMRLLLSRVTLRAAILEGDTTLGRDRFEELRTTSSAVLDFVLDLREHNFLDFWLPYATHLLVHAVTVSLRCAVETQDTEMRNSSISRLERVMSHIEQARNNYDWDIANYCLERCSDSVSKMASLTARDPQQPTNEAEASANIANGNEVQNNIAGFDDPTFLLSDLLDPNAFDFSWEALWDTPSGMTNFSI